MFTMPPKLVIGPRFSQLTRKAWASTKRTHKLVPREANVGETHPWSNVER